VEMTGDFIAAGGPTTHDEGGVRILRSATGEEVRYIPILKTRFYVRGLAFSPDASTLAIVRGRPDAANTYDIDLHDVADGQRRITIASGSVLGVFAISFSRDAKSLYTIDRGNGSVSIWDTATGQRRRQFTPIKAPADVAGATRGKPQVADAVFAPDLKTLVTRQGRDVVIWDIDRGEPISSVTTEGSDRGGHLGISQDGRLLSVSNFGYPGDPPSEIYVFDLESRRLMTTLECDRGRVGTFSFSPDGSRLATGMEDGTALVWDLNE